jgi:spore germination cell wall hydrolase CwlJ-like protein
MSNTSKLFGIMLFILGMFIVFPKQTLHNEIVNTVPVTVPVDAKQIACLAKNIFYEAGHESIQGQAAVARVVMNRVNHGFGKTPCQVIYQKTRIEDRIICQFSWVCENKPDPNKNSYRYKVAEQVAYDVIVNGKYKDVVPGSALFFHNTTIDPMWPYKKVAQIGGHIFYSKAKKVTAPKNKD